MYQILMTRKTKPKQTEREPKNKHQSRSYQCMREKEMTLMIE